MNPEEFLHHIGGARYYSDKGKARLNRTRRAYLAYRAAYTVTSFEEFYVEVRRATSLTDELAVKQAARDRDAGRAMAMVPDLL